MNIILYSREVFDVCNDSIFIANNKELKRYVSNNYQIRSRINYHITVPKSNTNANLRYLNYFAPKICNFIPLGPSINYITLRGEAVNKV